MKISHITSSSFDTNCQRGICAPNIYGKLGRKVFKFNIILILCCVLLDLTPQRHSLKATEIHSGVAVKVMQISCWTEVWCWTKSKWWWYMVKTQRGPSVVPCCLDGHVLPWLSLGFKLSPYDFRMTLRDFHAVLLNTATNKNNFIRAPQVA